MTTLETKPGTVVGFVPITKDAEDFSIADIGGKKTIGWFTEKESVEKLLLTGDWQILSTTDEISHEQMRKICPLHQESDIYSLFGEGLKTSYLVGECWQSLITHLKLSGRHLVIYKNENMSNEYTDKLDKCLAKVRDEVLRAKTMFPDNFVNQHEAYAVLLEETDELWDEIKKNQRNYDLDAQRKEATQSAAMVMRLLVELL